MGQTAQVRATNGRFQRGTPPGPGRPRGSVSQYVLDGREIRSRVFSVWDKMGGDALLCRWARDDFPSFFRGLVQLLPKDQHVEFTGRVMSVATLAQVLIPNGSPAAMRFVNRALENATQGAVSSRGYPSPAALLDALADTPEKEPLLRSCYIPKEIEKTEHATNGKKRGLEAENLVGNQTVLGDEHG